MQLKNTDRRDKITDWVTEVYTAPLEIKPLANDASFRRYFRLFFADHTRVLMDAPPPQEQIIPFVEIAHLFETHAIDVPHVYAMNEEEGWILLTDLGDDLYLSILTPENADMLYQKAINRLPAIQSCRLPTNNPYTLPLFDAHFVSQELALFTHWFLDKHLALSLTSAQQTLLDGTFKQIIETIEAQPQVCVHRDYHSRNLLNLKSGKVGIIDFQDACIGPLTYDLVSLLKDCYIDWPISQVEKWARDFYHQLTPRNSVSLDQFLTWFDWTGFQRHLKVLGIFSRLYHRDKKSSYLVYIPRILNYLLEVCKKYPSLDSFQQLLIETIQPQYKKVRV
jgi:aminoglycoside/choline kinase family phosphotransferase